jgi:hypothetical protein
MCVYTFISGGHFATALDIYILGPVINFVASKYWVSSVLLCGNAFGNIHLSKLTANVLPVTQAVLRVSLFFNRS